MFTYKVLHFLNSLCYPLIKILAVILWQMFRDFSGQFLPAYQGEYTKHGQNLLTTHMLYTKYCCSPRLYFEVCLYLHLFFEELYAFFMLIDCCANWISHDKVTGMHLLPSFLFYFSNFVQVYSESQQLNFNFTIMSCCVTKVFLHRDCLVLIQGILILSSSS